MLSAGARSLCIVVHDVAPATLPACERLLDEIAGIGDFAVSLLAVPRFHGAPSTPRFERWLRQRSARGDEVVLHGYEHLDTGRPAGVVDRWRRRVYTRGEAEFWSLDGREATRRLRAGRAWLRGAGLDARGFVAPAWLLGPAARQALDDEPFDYTCTLRRIELIGARGDPTSAAVVCQSQVFSSSTRWRRVASVVWNESLAALQRDAPLVRLELHPGDLAPPIDGCWRRLLRRQARTRRVRTLASVAGELRTARAPTAR